MIGQNILILAGAKGAGKALIRGMLDGHESVFVSPFHELLPFALSNHIRDFGELRAGDIQTLKETLAKGAKYFQLEMMSHRKFRLMDNGGDSGITSRKLDFDFYKLDKGWSNLIMAPNANWSPSEIMCLIYREMASQLYKNGSERGYQYFATMSDGIPGQFIPFLNCYPEAKIIYIKRNYVDVVAALVNRKPHGNTPETFARANLWKKYAGLDFLKSFARLEKEAAIANKEFGDRFLIVKFDEFFSDFNLIKNKIIDFLGIPDNRVLNEFTMLGEEVTSNDGQKIFSKEFDVVENILTLKEIRFLRLLSTLRIFS